MQSPIATASFLAKFVASKLQNGDGSGLESTMTPRFQSAQHKSWGKCPFPEPIPQMSGPKYQYWTENDKRKTRDG
ncbi:hypothetical protein YC2023_099381 [Brassica napus]